MPEVPYTYGDYWANKKLDDTTKTNEYSYNTSTGNWSMEPGGSQIGAIATFKHQGYQDAFTSFPLNANTYAYIPVEEVFVNHEVAYVSNNRIVPAQNGLYTMNLTMSVGMPSAPPANSVEKMIYASLDVGGQGQPQGNSPYQAYYSIDYSWVFANEELVFSATSTLVAGPNLNFRPMAYAGTLNWTVYGASVLVARAG